ncbi:MAG: hypothetical protein ACRYGC_11670 [Janthinobacterium lividum]
MRLGVWLAAGAAFGAMLLLDTQAVLELGWMAALGRLGAWPQRLLVGLVVAVAASRLVAAGLRRRRAARAPVRAVVRRVAKPAAAAVKAVRKSAPAPAPKGRRPAAPGVAAAKPRGPGRPTRA